MSAFDASVWRVVGDPLVRGRSGGPLAGLRVAVKDVFAVEGFPVGAGVPAYLDEAPVEAASADAVAALLDAGAEVVGIARTDQFAYSIAGANPAYGTPPNPAVPDGIPGGSTSGPSVAVSLGEAEVGLGTDTAGSIRVPASYQGLWGLRTTHGMLSREGMFPLAPSFDAVGWVARDAATLFAVLRASPQPGWRPAPRFLVWPGLTGALDAPVQDAMAAALDRLASGGYPADAIDPGVDPDALYEAFRTVQAAEAHRGPGEWVAAHPGALAPDVAARFAWAATVDAAAESDARGALAAAAAALDSALGDAVLLLPSAASAAPARDASPADLDAVRRSTLTLTAVAGATGRPALSVPVLSAPGPGGAPAPLGLCLVGPRGSDLALLEFGQALAGVLA